MNESDTSEAALGRVRQLLLSGDNIIKNRDTDDRFVRARERFERARDLAVASELEPGIVEIITRRLESLPPGGAA